jgi:hypothetical protein
VLNSTGQDLILRERIVRVWWRGNRTPTLLSILLVLCKSCVPAVMLMGDGDRYKNNWSSFLEFLSVWGEV